MKKLPLWSVIFITFFVFTSVLVAIYFFLLKQGAVFEKDSAVDMGFSAASDNVIEFVEDPDLGLYPGKKEFNEGANYFYKFLEYEEGVLQMQKEYLYLKVVEIVDSKTSEVVLYSSELGEKTYTFQCSPERTFAYKNLNMSFISSGFDFIETLNVGDTVLTKCYNDDCSVLGPDCILRVKVM